MDIVDSLAIEAATIFAAANKPHLEVTVTVDRRRNGSYCYTLIGYDTSHPLEIQCGYGMANTVDETLSRLAGSLSVDWPLASVVPMAFQQQEEIIRLINHPLITRQEKTKVLLNIHRFTKDQANEAIKALAKSIDARENGSSAAAA